LSYSHILSLHTIDEPGLARDFFQQFVQQDPVSAHAKLAFVTGFPALLSSRTQSRKSSEVIKNLKDSSMNSRQKKSEDSRRNNKKGFVFFPRRSSDSEIVAPIVRIVGIWDGFAPSLYAMVEKIPVWGKLIKAANKRIQHTGKYKAQVDSLLVNERETKMQEEIAATVLIVFYLIVLLVLSLPPAIIKRGKRVVAIVKRKIKKIQVAIKRTVSCTSLCSSTLNSANLSYRQSVRLINAMS
jgi:hypothetical protein